MALKLVYCIPSLFSFGGMEKVVTIKANYLADNFNYDITIILTDGKDKDPAFPLSPKIKVVNLDINYDKIWRCNIFIKFFIHHYKQILYEKRLKKALLEIKPDITVSMLRREINFLSHIKDGSIKVGELHFNRLNYRDFNTGGNAIGVKAFFAFIWMKQLIRELRKISKFVVLSHEDKANWEADISNIAVIHNPLSEYPNKLSDCSSKKVIAAGRYVSQKGFDMLLESWKVVTKSHPDWTLSIYGDGDRTAFEKMVEKYKMEDSVALNGAVTNLNSKFLESSIFAFSSRFEGFGMVVAEAMSCGIPAVSFACPCGPKDIITDNVNGLLVEPNNTTEFAQKLCYLIENENIRKEMGKSAALRSKDFDIKVIAEQWNNLFTELTHK